MSTRTPTSGAVRTRTNGSPSKKIVTAPIQFKRRAAPETVERIPLFSVDDVEYTMPKVVYKGDAIKWSSTLGTYRNEDVKAVALLRLLCGDEAANAVLDDSEMTEGQWKSLIKVMTEHAFGPTEREADQGN